MAKLYEKKFAKPAQAMMNSLEEETELLIQFEQEVQWVFWELWHHEGRRARHGASMMGRIHTLAWHV
ncbi:MAG: hypothetical protein U0586_08840 [Candidatus Brocadiaceae bacterium]